jgi:hypothetical protein
MAGHSEWRRGSARSGKVEWGSGRILVRDGANAGWINYMLKDRQKSEFDGFVDCIIIESLHNPNC